MRIFSFLRASVLTFGFVMPAVSLAGVPAAELIRHGMPADLANFAAAVSASEGDWTSVSGGGCAGAFQFCPNTLPSYYSGTREQFLADPAAQVQAYQEYMSDQWDQATSNNFDSLIGQEVCYEGQCATITASSIIKACQFGCAMSGDLGQFYRTGDCASAVDGAGTSVCTYLIRGSGYDVSGVTGDVGDPVEVASGGSGVCLQRPIMTSSGEAVSSPFGVDRTGRASAGYHLGLDMVNNAGRGDPIYAGVPGKVVYSRADSTNGVFVETPDGRQRFGYLHGAARKVAEGEEVTPDTQVITMGDSGSPGAVHLHLYAAISGEAMAEVGEAAGVVWPARNRSDFWGDKGSSGLTGASLTGAAPAPFYIVNPETYLDHRIPFRESLLNSEHYRRQGLIRPDGLTLEPTCRPSTDMLARGGVASSNGGATMDGGMAATGTAPAANMQTQVNMASSDGRDAAIQYGQAAVGSLRRSGTMGNSSRSSISVMAGLIITSGSLLATGGAQ